MPIRLQIHNTLTSPNSQKCRPHLELPTPPYTEEMTFNQKFHATERAFRRTVRLKDRVLSLVNTYYLGRLLASLETIGEMFRYKQKVSKHYATMAEYTYDLFELQPKQIMRVRFLSVQRIKKLKRS